MSTDFRRVKFLGILFPLFFLLHACSPEEASDRKEANKTSEVGNINTVSGEISTAEMGNTLIHEHLLVDFIGADSTGFHRWDREEVVSVVLPYLQEIKAQGVKTLFDCTPAFLGRDAVLLKMLADSSGLQIITNTGYYGAADNKYLPYNTYIENAATIAKRWTNEFTYGIDSIDVKPGFIKIGVETGSLSGLHEKLIRAAALTHLETGLTIASHTLYAIPAFDQIAVLQSMGVSPEAFIWVHAQAEENKDKYIEAAKLGAWISLDGLKDENLNEYLLMLNKMKEADLLNKVLISHDAGWYSPGEENGGNFRSYSTLFGKFIPYLKKQGYTDEEVEQLVVKNPIEAFSIKVRKL